MSPIMFLPISSDTTKQLNSTQAYNYDATLQLNLDEYTIPPNASQPQEDLQPIQPNYNFALASNTQENNINQLYNHQNYKNGNDIKPTNSISSSMSSTFNDLSNANSPYLPIVIAALIVTVIFVAIRCSKDSSNGLESRSSREGTQNEHLSSNDTTPEHNDQNGNSNVNESAGTEQPTTTASGRRNRTARLLRCFQHRSSQNNRYGGSTRQRSHSDSGDRREERRSNSSRRRTRSRNRFMAVNSYPSAPILMNASQRYLGSTKLPKYTKPNVAIMEGDKIIMDAYQLSIDSELTRTLGYSTYNSNYNNTVHGHVGHATTVQGMGFGQGIGQGIGQATGPSAPANLAEMKRFVDNYRKHMLKDPLSEKKYNHQKRQFDIEDEVLNINQKNNNVCHLNMKKTAPQYTSNEDIFQWMRNYEYLSHPDKITYDRPPPLEELPSENSTKESNSNSNKSENSEASQSEKEHIVTVPLQQPKSAIASLTDLFTGISGRSSFKEKINNPNVCMSPKLEKEEIQMEESLNLLPSRQNSENSHSSSSKRHSTSQNFIKGEEKFLKVQNNDQISRREVKGRDGDEGDDDLTDEILPGCL